VIDINVMSIVRSNEVFVLHMLDQGHGQRVYTASWEGLFRAQRNQAPYSATKSAVVAWCDALWMYLRPRGIGVTCVAPGAVVTGISDHMRIFGDPSPMRFRDWLGWDSITRGRRADEIINMLRGLWTEENVTYASEFCRFGPVSLRPKPFQPDGVPIEVGETSKIALRRAAVLGDGWIDIDSEDLGQVAWRVATITGTPLSGVDVAEWAAGFREEIIEPLQLPEANGWQATERAQHVGLTRLARYSRRYLGFAVCTRSRTPAALKNVGRSAGRYSRCRRAVSSSSAIRKRCNSASEPCKSPHRCRSCSMFSVSRLPAS
jgi:hypothetical protein